MANRRDIKKDINFLTYQVISECYSYIEYSPNLSYENVSDIILEAIDLRNNLIYRVNHLNHTDTKKGIKSYFNSIIDDLYSKNIELIEKLNKLQ